MIEFNQELQNYTSKNFGIITLDKIGTKIRDDAYTIDQYDDEHFFVGMYITNPFYLINKEKLLHRAFSLKENRINKDFINKYLRIGSLDQGKEHNVFAFKFLIDIEGNITDFSINKENIKIDYEMNNEDIDYLFETDDEDLKEEEISIRYMLEVMHTVSDLIYMNQKKKNHAEDRDLNIPFLNSFFIQFLNLVNVYVPKLFEKENFPLLYQNTKSLDTTADITHAYYKSTFEGNAIYQEPVGKFTSPLWETASVINLAILDDLVFDKYGIAKYKAMEWKDTLENVEIIKINKTFYKQIWNKYYRK